MQTPVAHRGLAVAFLLFGYVATADAEYTITDLGAFDGYLNRAEGINNIGQVAGTAHTHSKRE